MTARRRILILDDETKVAFFLRESLDTLGYDFEVVSVSSPDDALREIRREKFDLLVTDQHMPGMSGLELIQRVRERNPGMQFILITAYGSEDVLAAAQRLGAFRYFTKPFHIEDFVQTVLDALENNDGRSNEALSDRDANVMNIRLEELRREVGAQCVLASDAAGTIVAQAGNLTEVDLEQLLRLATDHFGASLAVSQHFSEMHGGNLAYFEGINYDVYFSNVQDDLFLVIVFDRRIQSSRVGIVWLYVRRVAETLRRVRSVLPVSVPLN